MSRHPLPKCTRRAALAVLPLLAGLLCASGATVVAPVASAATVGFVHRSGTSLVDGSGAPLTLRGVNLGNWLLQENWLMGSAQTNTGQTTMFTRLASVVGQGSADAFLGEIEAGYITRADIDAIAGLGLNVVRVPFDYRLLEDDAAPGVYKDSGWALLDNIVDWAEADGIYVVLDLHAAPGAQSNSWHADPTAGAQLWKNTADQDRTVALWTAIAARYANRPGIAGYDLLNEPAPPTAAALAGLYQRIITGIRSVDQNHLVFVEGTSYATNTSVFTTRYDDNEAISIHQYTWGTATPEWNITSAERTAARLNLPVWVGEMGDDTAANIANRVARYNGDPKLSGWCDWTWKGAIQANGRRQVNEFTPTTTWLKTIKWMAGTLFAPKPTPAQAQQGMADYLAMITTATPDAGVIAALTGA